MSLTTHSCAIFASTYPRSIYHCDFSVDISSLLRIASVRHTNNTLHLIYGLIQTASLSPLRVPGSPSFHCSISDDMFCRQPVCHGAHLAHSTPPVCHCCVKFLSCLSFCHWCSRSINSVHPSTHHCLAAVGFMEPHDEQ